MPAQRPNILLICMDDQRYDTIAALGCPVAHTPNLDGLVRRGIAFTCAHNQGSTHSGVCMPARGMLFTGRGLFRIGGGDRAGQDLLPRHALLGETLRAAGYATFGTGKWHNGAAAYQRCFADGGAIFVRPMTDDHYAALFHDWRADGSYPYDGGLVERRHTSEVIADAAIACLGRHDGARPFFLYTAFLAPHDPRQAPPQWRARFHDEDMPLPPSFCDRHPFDNGEMEVRDEKLSPWPRTEAGIRRHIADYHAMIAHADEQIGRIFAAIAARGWSDDTIVAFTSDHGLAVGGHGLMGKQSMYDHSLRVPLLLAGPGVPAGQRRATLNYHSDVHPTLLDLAGVPIPTSVERRSLAPCLYDPARVHRQDLLFAYRDVQRAIRCGDHKLIAYAVGGRLRLQLFDLAADPHELRDLADDPAWATRRDELFERLTAWRSEEGDVHGHGKRFWAVAAPADQP